MRAITAASASSASRIRVWTSSALTPGTYKPAEDSIHRISTQA